MIVPAFNEEKLIAPCLLSMKSAMNVFTDSGWDSELIVCDNNSTDRTADIARESGAKVVFESVNQIGRARNTGASVATGDWFVFVDADSHPSPGLFRDLCGVIRGGKVLFGGATIRFDRAPFSARCVVNLWNLVSRVGKYAAGSFIFCEVSAFREIGGFDQGLYASEEIDLSKRLKRVAKQRGKTAVIIHRHPLVTSSRKIHLYSSAEHLKFMVRALVGWRKILGNRDECHIWYDGRR